MLNTCFTHVMCLIKYMFCTIPFTKCIKHATTYKKPGSTYVKHMFNTCSTYKKSTSHVLYLTYVKQMVNTL